MPACFRERQWWFDVVLLALVYWLVAWLGFRLAPAYANVTAIWFPSGIALAVLLVRGINRWPAALLGPVLFTQTIGVPWHLSLLSGMGDMLSSLVACWLLHRFHFNPRIAHFRDALLLIFLGAAFPTILGGGIGATTLVMGGVAPIEMWPLVFKVWWLADFGGALTLTPLLLALACPQKPWRELDIEAVILAAVFLLACALAFGMAKDVFHGNPIPAYLVFPFIIWAAVRYGHLATSWMVMVACLAAIAGSVLYLDPSNAVRSLQVLNLQMFLSVVSGVGLVMVAATNQQRQIADQLVADIAKREAVEAELRRSESNYRALFDHAAAGIAHVTLDGRFVAFNRKLTEILGYSRAQLMALDFRRITYPDDLEPSLEGVRKLLAGETDHLEIEKRYVRGDGSVLWARLTTSLYRDPEGVPGYYVSVVQDIDAQKRAQEALRLHQEHLEELVELRTKELASFSYSVSHDLRAPLRLIDGMSLFLLEDYSERLDDTGRDYLARIRRGVQKMAELIDGLLDLAQISRAELSTGEANLSSIAIELADELRQLYPHHPVTLMVQPDMQVRGDSKLLRAAMQNLLGNAWKFTSKTTGAEVSVGSRHEGGRTVYFVRDNGAGFDMKQADKLFGAFQRLHGERDFEGHGIGLATVSRIIHRHHGRIWAEGEPNAGACFYFTLHEDAPAPAG